MRRSALFVALVGSCMAGFAAAGDPGCALQGDTCSATLSPPPPPFAGPCLEDGATWSSNPTDECCSKQPFGQYCTCMPAGAAVGGSCLACCSSSCSAGVCSAAAPPPRPPSVPQNCTWQTSETAAPYFKLGASQSYNSTNITACPAPLTFANPMRSGCATNDANVVVFNIGVASTQTNGCKTVAGKFLPQTYTLASDHDIILESFFASCNGAGPGGFNVTISVGGDDVQVNSATCSTSADTYTLPGSGLSISAGSNATVTVVTDSSYDPIDGMYMAVTMWNGQCTSC